MRRILHWVNRTFVYFITSGVLTWASVEALITKEVTIYGWRGTALLAGFGLNTFTAESNPQKFWTITIFYLMSGVACGIVFAVKIKTRKRANNRIHDILQ